MTDILMFHSNPDSETLAAAEAEAKSNDKIDADDEEDEKRGSSSSSNQKSTKKNKKGKGKATGPQPSATSSQQLLIGDGIVVGVTQEMLATMDDFVYKVMEDSDSTEQQQIGKPHFSFLNVKGTILFFRRLCILRPDCILQGQGQEAGQKLRDSDVLGQSDDRNADWAGRFKARQGTGLVRNPPPSAPLLGPGMYVNIPADFHGSINAGLRKLPCRCRVDARSHQIAL